MGRAADQSDISISALLANQAALTPELAAAAGALSAGTIAYLAQVEAIDALKTDVGTLPGVLDSAQTAMRDKEGEIVDDLDRFFSNLQEEMANRAAFESNLAILRAFGLDDLATVFDQAGQEAAGALAEAVADPAKAGQIEAQLQGDARSQADAYAAAFDEALANKPVTQGLIDNILIAASLADSPEVQASLLDLAGRLNEQLNLTPEIQSPTFAAGFKMPGFDFLRVNTEGFLPPAGAGGGTPTIVNNFYDTPQPTTDTVRITQSLTRITGAQ